jgi:opacity protein-like surface antigen
MYKFHPTLLIFLLSAGSAIAQDIGDLDALRLADTAPKHVESSSDWHWFTEAVTGQFYLRKDGTTISEQRWSVDLQFDKTLAPGWRVVFSDRLDLKRRDQPVIEDKVNTLKEAYLSRQIQENQILDFGRINVFNGVASGYNPTDFFRVGAVRSLVSVDPASLKKNRLGSAMLRGQHLWSDGSFTALYSPKLAERPNAASFSPDFGASNNQDRYLLSISQKLVDGITPQWLIYGKPNHAPLFGFNLTGLLNDSTVLYAEWSGGNSRSLLSLALNGKDDTAFRNRIASGLSYTTSNKLTLTFEYEYSGTGLESDNWDKLRNGSPLAYIRYRALQQYAQELPTKQEVFFFANWQDAGLNHLDLSVMQKLNLADHSRLTWLEVRYRMDKVDLALQMQNNRGDQTSAYGAAAQQRAWQASIRLYF